MGRENQAPAALPVGMRPGTQNTGDCVGPSAGLNLCGKLDPRTLQLVAICRTDRAIAAAKTQVRS